MKNFLQLHKTDLFLMALLTFIFAALAFFRLGNAYAPVTTYTTSTDNTDIVLDLGEDTYVQYISIFLGHLNTRHLSISAYNMEEGEWEIINGDTAAESVFAWNKIEINFPLRYLGIVATDDEAYFNELIIVNAGSQVIRPQNFYEYPQLFDEQHMFSLPDTYMTGTMFDEVYHGRSAYEFIHGLTTYETTHPPLGKSIISLGIRIFGMNPFGWRFMSAIFGIIIIPLFYLFVRRLFDSTWIAFATTFLFVFDFMHYALSRIATIDIFAAFFILLMYFFMHEYLLRSRNASLLPEAEQSLTGELLIPLGLCGISMGLGIATKWTGVYAAAGLAVLFAWNFFRHRCKHTFKLILFCCVCFIILPVCIYILSYIPFVSYSETTNLVTKVVENTQYIFDYHANLEAEHYYSTPFYEWPVIWMPLLYANTAINETQVSAVSCMGNPAVWWVGYFCVIYVIYLALFKKDKTAGFLAVAYLAQYLPWMAVGRITFIYHYFPAILFVIMMIGYTIQKIATRFSFGRKLTAVYLLLVLAAFILFFPVISGLPIDKEWGMKLRLLRDWILVL